MGINNEFVPKVWADKIKEAAYSTYLLPAIFQMEPQTDEQRAASEARRAARKAYLVELRDLLANTTDPVARSVAVLHQPDKYDQCDGCDFGGWEAESPDWPCRTATLLGDLLGLEEPA